MLSRLVAAQRHLRCVSWGVVRCVSWGVCNPPPSYVNMQSTVYLGMRCNKAVSGQRPAGVAVAVKSFG